MSNSAVRWLLDAGLPRTTGSAVDAVHAADFPRVPGPSGIREAAAWDRTLVTCDQEFRGPWVLPPDHPGIVVLEDRPNEGPALERSLLHFEFRLRQYGGDAALPGNRFVVMADRKVLQVLPDGTEAALTPWLQVRMASCAEEAVLSRA